MRLALLILRKNYYRLLGPVVEEALARGCAVECWHDWSGRRDGHKGSEFPDAAPTFRAGVATVKTYNGPADLAAQLRLDPPDAVISIDPPEPELRAAVKAAWIWLQYGADILFQPTARGVLDVDGLGLYGPAWRELIERRFGPERVSAELAAKSTVIGAPELDAVHGIDRDEVRRRLGLAPNRPLVLFLPFPLRSNWPTTWLRHVYAPASRLEQGVRTILAGAGRYWPHVVRGWNDRRLVEAVRDFCDRNGARLVMKARRKDPLPRYAERLADHAFYDPSHHPPTILELLSVASLCVHFYSTTALEAAYCGVPSLCLAPAEDELGPRSLGFGFVHNGEPHGLYNTPGVSYWRPLTAAFDGLRRWTLSDFPLEPPARRQYVERFLGFADGRSSARLLDAVVEPALARRLAGRSPS